jgi:serine/threonine protein kinase
MQSIRFGDYFLLDAIHTGSTTEIYKASRGNGEDGKPTIAVKRLIADLVDDTQAKSRLKEEARIAVQLTHGNVAQVLDSGDVDGEFFIATEYIHGKDLRDVFLRQRTRSRRLPLAIPCFIAMQICEGLHYLHEKKSASGAPLELMHCAIAPQNIIVSYDGQVKIIDFGRACSAKKASDRRLDEEKWVPGYLSPEQAQAGDLDRRSDIFNVGICLYELLTGERLFTDATDFSALQQVRNVDIPSPRSVNRQIPEELEHVVLKALARDRVNRYQTALELHDHLQSFMYDNRQLCGKKELGDHLRTLFEEEAEERVTNDITPLPTDDDDRRDKTGLIAFSDLEPVAVTKLTAMASLQRAPEPIESHPESAPVTPSRAVSKPPPTPAPSRPPRPSSSPHYQATLLGLPNLPQPIYQPSSGSSEAATREYIPASMSGPMGQRNTPPLADTYSDETPAGPSGATIMGIGAASVGAATQGSVPPMVPGEIPRIASRPPDLDDTDDEAKTGLYAMSYELKETLLQALKTNAAQNETDATSSDAPAASAAAFSQGAGSEQTDVYGQEPYPKPVLAEAKTSLEAAKDNSSSNLQTVAVAAAIAVLLVGFFLMKKPAAGTINLTTLPADTTIKIDGQPFSGSSSPFVISDLTPNAAHQIVVSKEGYGSWSTSVELTPGQNLVLPPVSLDPIQTDTGFTIDSKPTNARVYVDGKDFAQNTPARIIGLSPGIHDIRVESTSGYAPWKTQVKINKNQLIELPLAELSPLVPLTPAKTSLAAVAQTRVPAEQTKAEPAGWLRAPSKTSKSTATPSSRSTATRQRAPVSSVPAAEAASKPSGQGMLRINSRPWAQVFVDNRLVGNTPQMGIVVPAGKHNITLVNPTFGMKKTIPVSVRPGETITKIVALNP